MRDEPVSFSNSQVSRPGEPIQLNLKIFVNSPNQPAMVLNPEQHQHQPEPRRLLQPQHQPINSNNNSFPFNNLLTSKSIFTSKPNLDHHEEKIRTPPVAMPPKPQIHFNNPQIPMPNQSKWNGTYYQMQEPIQTYHCPICNQTIKMKESYLHLEKHRNRVKPNRKNQQVLYNYFNKKKGKSPSPRESQKLEKNQVKKQQSIQNPSTIKSAEDQFPESYILSLNSKVISEKRKEQKQQQENNKLKPELPAQEKQIPAPGLQQSMEENLYIKNSLIPQYVMDRNLSWQNSIQSQNTHNQDGRRSQQLHSEQAKQNTGNSTPTFLEAPQEIKPMRQATASEVVNFQIIQSQAENQNSEKSQEKPQKPQIYQPQKKNQKILIQQMSEVQEESMILLYQQEEEIETPKIRRNNKTMNYVVNNGENNDKNNSVCKIILPQSQSQIKEDPQSQKKKHRLFYKDCSDRIKEKSQSSESQREFELAEITGSMSPLNASSNNRRQTSNSLAQEGKKSEQSFQQKLKEKKYQYIKKRQYALRRSLTDRSESEGKSDLYSQKSENNYQQRSPRRPDTTANGRQTKDRQIDFSHRDSIFKKAPSPFKKKNPSNKLALY